MASRIEDEDELQGAPEAAEEVTGETAVPEATAPAAAPAAVPSVRDYIAQKYNLAGPPQSPDAEFQKLAGDNSKVAQARADAQDEKSHANVWEGITKLVGGRDHNKDYFKSERADADKKVQAAEDDHKALIANYLQGKQLGWQDEQHGHDRKSWEQQDTDSEFKNQQNDRTTDRQDAEDDPDSQESQYARRVAQTLDPKGDYSDLNATQIKANMPLVKDIYDKSMRSQDMALRWGEGNRAKAAAADNKRIEGQGKNYVKMNGEILGQGRAPADVKQAQKDNLAADKANKLLTGNLNELGPTQAHLAMDEVAKLATGGVATDAVRSGLDPKTFAEDWATFKNKFAGPDGTVSNANMGPFLQQHKDYLDGMHQITQNLLHKYQRNVYDGYVDGGQISPEHQEKFQTRHPELFPELQDDKSSAAPAGAAPAAPTKAPPPPPVGSVIDGHRFKGGDPSQQSSWEEVK